MIPIQYRDSETEEILDLTYEKNCPQIGERVIIDGVGECQVLYRWRGAPTSCAVYVRKVKVLAVVC